MRVLDSIIEHSINLDLDIVSSDSLLLLNLKHLLFQRVLVRHHLVQGNFQVEACLHHMAEAAIALHDELVPLRHHYETIPDLRHQSPPIKIIISMALIDLYQ